MRLFCYFYFFSVANFAEYTICDESMGKKLDYICLKRLKYLLLLSFPKSIWRYWFKKKALFYIFIFSEGT